MIDSLGSLGESAGKTRADYSIGPVLYFIQSVPGPSASENALSASARHAMAAARSDHTAHTHTPAVGELSADDLRAAYRLMLLSRRLDDKEIQLKNQSQIFFQISGAGHEAILVAAGMALRPGHDWFCAYYRDRALCLTLGVTPYDMLLQAVGAKDDPASHGRQMPSHWGNPALHIISQGSPTGHAVPAVVGAAEAGRLYERIEAIPDRDALFRSDEVVYCSVGDGATSEGEFWESLNTASHEKLPRRLRGRRQRLCHLGSGRSADGGRIDLEPCRALSASEGDPRRRLRLRQELRRHARCRAVGPRTSRARAGPCVGRPAVLALAVGR